MEDIKTFARYYHESAQELDHYLREMTRYLHEQKDFIQLEKLIDEDLICET